MTKSYTGVAAVRDVSFLIHSGEILGCVGANGAGKSTTVKMLAGLVEPTGGHIYFEGRRIDADLAAYKRQIGYVPEAARLYPFMTGWEYLEMVATIREMPSRSFAEKAMSMLRSFAMYSDRNSPISSYSRGMRQRILLIAALMHAPRVLILDEPLAGLDAGGAIVCRLVIQKLAHVGRAVFFCSPVLEVVEKLCTNLVLLRCGEIAAFGSMDEIRARTSDPPLERFFLDLTGQQDVDRIATEIVAASVEPWR